MVHNLNHCTFGLNPRAAVDRHLPARLRAATGMSIMSIPTPSIAIAASRDAERLTREIFGKEIGYLPWQRPGIDLGIKLGRDGGEPPGLCRRRTRQPRLVHLGR